MSSPSDSEPARKKAKSVPPSAIAESLDLVSTYRKQIDDDVETANKALTDKLAMLENATRAVRTQEAETFALRIYQRFLRIATEKGLMKEIQVQISDWHPWCPIDTQMKDVEMAEAFDNNDKKELCKVSLEAMCSEIGYKVSIGEQIPTWFNTFTVQFQRASEPGFP